MVILPAQKPQLALPRQQHESKYTSHRLSQLSSSAPCAGSGATLFAHDSTLELYEWIWFGDRGTFLSPGPALNLVCVLDLAPVCCTPARSSCMAVKANTLAAVSGLLPGGSNVICLTVKNIIATLQRVSVSNKKQLCLSLKCMSSVVLCVRFRWYVVVSKLFKVGAVAVAFKAAVVVFV